MRKLEISLLFLGLGLGSSIWGCRGDDSTGSKATPIPRSQSSNTDPSIFFNTPSTDSAFEDYLRQNECETNNLARRCKLSGVEITLDPGGRVTGVIYFLGDDPVYQGYQGPLPGGISVTDTKAAVDKKIGPPSSVGSDFAVYPAQVPGTISLVAQFAPVGGPLASHSTLRRVSFRRR